MGDTSIFASLVALAIVVAACIIGPFIKRVILNEVVEDKYFCYKNQIYYVIPENLCQGLFKKDQAPDSFRARNRDWPLYDLKNSFAVDISEEKSTKSTNRK